MSDIDPDRIVTHDHPAWREKTDFIIRAAVSGRPTVEAEQLWTRRLGERTFELCCIPFLVDGALGDELETDESLRMTRVSRRRGARKFITFMADARDPAAIGDRVVAEADRLGCLWEVLSWAGMIAIDARTEAVAQELSAALVRLESELGLVVVR